MKKTVAILFASILGLCIYSCSTNGCEETRESYCYADIKAESKAKTLNSLIIWYNDTLIDESYSSSPTSIELVLPPDSSHIQYRFDMTVKVDDEELQVSDTLDIHYEAFPYFLNMECGCSVYFTIHSVESTQNFWKNVDLVNKDITNEEAVNLRIEY